MGPLKSRHARRNLPIPVELAEALRAHLGSRGSRELAFESEARTVLDPDNLAERVLAPACSEAGVEWAGFHTFRHTVASRLFAQGRNVLQVQKWLGHTPRASHSTPTSTSWRATSVTLSSLPGSTKGQQAVRK